MVVKLAPDELGAMNALQSIEDELAVRSVAALSKGELCEKYRKIRGFLETVLPFVKKIPIYGKKIADAIQFLMTLADMACPN